MAFGILFCLFLFIPLAKQHATQDALNDVVSTIETVVGFFQDDYKNLNLDGLFGLRVLEGHLGAVVQKHASGELGHLPVSIIGRVQILKNKTTHICQAAIDDVKSDDREYFQRMSYVVRGPWDVFDGARKRIEPSKIWSDLAYKYAKSTGVKVNEKTSDKCMSELMGSHKAQGQPCDISDKCANVMTHPGLLGYGITHQILWTMLAEKAGCRNQLDAVLSQIQRGSVQTVRLELCTNNYVQLMDTVSKVNGVVPSELQDLFLETLFMCPSLGFYEFLDIDYLHQIKSWQHKSGCFGEMPTNSKDSMPGINEDLTGNEDKHTNEDVLFKDVKSIDLQGIINGLSANTNRKMPHNNMAVAMEQMVNKENLRSWNTPRYSGRRLLIEKEMSYGCLSHKTAVASGALVLYLRFLSEPDADLIFNKSTGLRTIKSVPTYDLQKPAQKVVKPADSEAAVKLDVDPKNMGKIDSKSIDKNQKQTVIGNEINGSINDSVKGIVSNKGKFQDNGKRFLHGDDIGNQHFGDNLHQIQAPKIHGKLDSLQMPPNGGRQDEEFYNDVNADIGDEDDEDDDYADEDEDDDEDEEDGYDYDHEIGKQGPNKKDYDADFPGNHNQKHEILNPGHYQDVNNNDDNDQLDDNYDADDDDDDDYDGDYVDNNEDDIAHPHINARNIGHNKNQNYDHAGYDQYEKSMKRDKEYEYDDEDEEDEYEYDDENDEKENKRQEIFEKEIENIPTSKKSLNSAVKHPDLHISSNKVSPKTAIFVILTCFTLTLLFMYRFIRKRRIRIRFSPKYFHV